MSAATKNALHAYSVAGAAATEGASPHALILMLFDGAIKAVAKARMAMAKGEIAPKCEAISKAVAIIQDGLQLSLDTRAGGEMAENLNALYEYMVNRLVLANLKNQLEPLDEVGKLLVDLKNAWSQIAPVGKSQKQPAGVVADNPPMQRNAAISYGKV